MLCGGIEVDVTQDLLGFLAVELSGAVDDLHTILTIGECLGGHKGVLAAVCTVVVNSAAPGIQLAVLGVSTTGASLDALAAVVAQMGSSQLGGGQLCIGEDEAVADEGTVVVGQQGADHALLTQAALYSAVEEVQLVLGLHTTVNVVEVHLGVGAFQLVLDQRALSLGNRNEAFLFDEVTDVQQSQRHHGLFQVLNTHSGVLVVGSAFFHAAVDTTQHTEAQTDDGLGAGEDLEDGIVSGETISGGEAYDVSIVALGAGDNFFDHKMPSSFKCL